MNLLMHASRLWQVRRDLTHASSDATSPSSQTRPRGREMNGDGAKHWGIKHNESKYKYRSTQNAVYKYISTKRIQNRMKHTIILKVLTNYQTQPQPSRTPTHKNSGRHRLRQVCRRSVFSSPFGVQRNSRRASTFTTHTVEIDHDLPVRLPVRSATGIRFGEGRVAHQRSDPIRGFRGLL